MLNLWPITFFIFQGGKDHMKKNLRIVSAAAAALLAVAPVAAATVAPATYVSAATADSFATGNVKVNNGKVSLGSLSYAGDTTTTTLTDKLNSAVQKLLGSNQVSVTNVKYDSASKQVTFEVVAPRNWNDGKINLNNVELSGAQWTNSTTDGNKTTATTNDSDKTVLSFSATVLATSATKPGDSASTSLNAGSSTVFNANANTTVTISAVAKNGSIPSAINGGISVSLGGQTYEALLHTDGNQNATEIFTANSAKKVAANNMTAGHYIAVIRHATVFVGNDKAGTTQAFTLSRGAFGSNASATKMVTVGSNGVADLGEIQVPFYAYDATKEQGVHFYEVSTGNVATSGNVTLHAVNGKLSVQAVYAALNAKYGASQFRGGLDNDPDVLKPVNDLRDQLEKQNINDVDPNGYFTAPASFTVNMHAKSNLNGATASLPVTVTVDNVTPTAANETTTTKTVMHIATIYDKNGNATSEPVLRAYDSVSVVSTPVELKDAAGKSKGMYYKLAGKDQYVKVGNIDGTSRTLKHNAYVYKSNGKRNKAFKTLKKGSSKTTYGKSFMINGSQMYRVGRNQYVKVANFR